LRREFLISCIGHIAIVLIAFLVSAFTKPMELPQKVYTVKIIAAPRPEAIEKSEVKPEPEPVPEIQAEPKPVPKPKPKPKSEPKPQEPEDKTSPTGKGHITVDGPDLVDDFYLNLIYMKVYRNWIPPSTGRKLSTTIYFLITRGGQVKNAKVEKRCGTPSFDQKALRTVLSASPFPDLPESYTGDHLSIHCEFVHNP